MKLLVYSSLFPSAAVPHHGIFVAERLQRWRQRHGGEARVVAPVPWAPPFGPARWTDYRAIAREERFEDLRVVHPRFVSPPGFGDGWRAALMASGTAAVTRAEAVDFAPDVLDAHYAWPDGAAAVALRPQLERRLGRRLPLVITARGTDLNLSPAQPSVRPRLAAALAAADHVVCVAEALRQVALELGLPPERVTTLRNGVDVRRFLPGDRAAARSALGLPADRRILLCVGHLVLRKGQDLLLAAAARTWPARSERPLLVLVGAGPDQPRFTAQAAGLGLSDDVLFAGAVPPAQLLPWYHAADALVLPSRREGWPNVVLEALACGLPVLATDIWGTPEILRGCAAGRLVPPDVDGLAAGLAELDTLDASAARPWAEAHTWDATLDGLDSIFRRVVRA